MKALVTGCCGFIGSELTERLLEDGWSIRGLDDLSTGSPDALDGLEGNVDFVEGSVLDASYGLFEGVDTVFHLAAQTTVPGSTRSPEEDFDQNAEGTFRVLKLAEDVGADVVYTSTCTVYGLADVPTPEDTSLRPESLYGASKAVGDLYCSAFHGTFGTRAISLRLYNVYGPGTDKGVMFDFMRKLTDDPERLEILGSGRQEKDYVYIDDVVDALVLSAEEGRGGEAYNVGTGVSTSVDEVARVVSEVMGLDPDFEHTGGKAWRGDVEEACADTSKLEELGWRPTVSVREGVERMYGWFEETFPEEAVM